MPLLPTEAPEAAVAPTTTLLLGGPHPSTPPMEARAAAGPPHTPILLARNHQSRLY
jgi:hypothetical protein